MSSESDFAREVSSDTLFDGRLKCFQHKDGYRFSVDAVLLAHFSAPHRRERVLDLGCGCGVVALVMAFRDTNIHIDCLELQAGLACLAARNISENGFADRVAVIEGDMRDCVELFDGRVYDRVVCNPPYRRRDGSRLNRDPEQAAARHELTADLEVVIGAASIGLGIGGRLDLIYPASRSANLLPALPTVPLSRKGCRWSTAIPARRVSWSSLRR